MSDLTCPMHPDAHLIEDHRAGDLVCPECGLVVGDRIVDVGTEWRSFNNEKSCKDPSRVGAPENALLSGSDLSTNIEAGPSSSQGDYDLKNHQRQQMNSTDRQLRQAFGTIREMAARINLTKSIVDQSNKVFKDVLETKALRGKNHEAVAAACLYIACRKEGVPRTFKEICAVSKTSKKEIGKCFRQIVKALETSLTHITSDQFMNRFCSHLELPHAVQHLALHIARKAVNLDLVAGRSPISLAAASIYMASQATPENKKSAKEIAEVVGAAEVTIKQTYKLLHPRALDLIPADNKFYPNVKNLPAN